MNRYLSEFLGTFALVFAGTGAIIVNDVSGGAISHVGIALTFGLVVMVMIYAVGDISGAHFNSAVTLGFWLAGRLPVREVAPYIGSQLVGGLLASLLLRLVFSEHSGLGVTQPSVTVFGAFLFEVLLTFFLMFVIIHVSSGAKERGITAGLAIGATVCLDALFGGPITGASMNPARSLAPALVAGHFDHLWLYLLAPVVGAFLAVAAFGLTSGEEARA
jgi:aquaporin Z